MPQGGSRVSQTIVFIHGAWVTPLSWQPFVGFFEERGYTCIAFAWPGKDRSVEAIRADPSPLVGVGIAEIVDHYALIISEAACGSPPAPSG
jgi:alpha-beta hydrolase superfamily lysophospholipase